jgi:hypothetical protein
LDRPAPLQPERRLEERLPHPTNAEIDGVEIS